MSDIYSSLSISPRKKRAFNSSDDESTLTPKKLRIAPPTPPKSAQKPPKQPLSLPSHLSRLNSIQTALHHALSHALATCAVSPSSDTGIIRNVLNHLSISTYAGLTTKFDINDLKRMCWIWEWDGQSIPVPKDTAKVADDLNPFLDSLAPAPPKDWTRGSMGFIISPTTHFSKSAGKRVPVYGIGIEVEMDIDKDMTGGMAAVARWTADADRRRAKFRSKLESWLKLHPNTSPIPNIPLADLPELTNHAIKASSLTVALASASPKGVAMLTGMVPSSPTSPSKSPSKSHAQRSSAAREFPVPFPKSPFQEPTHPKSSVPQTPSSRHKGVDPLAGLLTPKTPARKRLGNEGSDSLPTTPIHQRGSDAETAPPTPSTSRRQALYERVRLKSLSSTPVKAKSAEIAGGKLTKDQIQKLGQEEIRRRCLLGRLGGVAESTWMLFSSPVGSTATPTARKRKALPANDVLTAIVKSSPVPMSISEASESLKLLTSLCPFFLRQLDINGEEWFEMPTTASTSDAAEIPTKLASLSSPSKASSSKVVPPPSPSSIFFGSGPPPSPGSKARLDSEEVLLTRSPRRVKREAGGIREVREIIRKELELHD